MMGDVAKVDNKQWIWIIIAFLLLTSCTSGVGGSGCGIGGSISNFLTEIKCGNNSWIWILALVFLFSDMF